MPRRRFVHIATLLLPLALAGCGAMPEATPTPAPPAVETAPAGVATPAATAAAKLTLGELAGRVDAAWANVASYRVVSIVAAPPVPAATPIGAARATPGATPVSAAGQVVATRDVILPDIQRLEVSVWGTNDFEAISDGETIYVRGPLAAHIDASAGPEQWITLRASDVPEDSQIANLLGGLPVVPMPPFAGIAERLELQEVRDLGPIEVGGRTCQTYGAADTKLTTGQRVDYVVGIDTDDLPCFIETLSGTTSLGRQEYSLFNEVAAVDVPAAGTPVAIPAAMATPVHHD
ncbi:MAG: hypothetical protein R2853_00515 [Thermomicrobiales bacterium]